MKAAMRKNSDDQNQRFARFQPRSIDLESRTFEAVIATETPVQIGRGLHEILRITPGSIEASRLIGMPLLDSHDRGSIHKVLGRVEAFRIGKGELIATIRFDESADANAVFARVQSGMISKVSIGYRTLEIEEAKSRDGTLVETVTRWEPFEVSLVSVPADPNAKIRGIPNMKKPMKRQVSTVTTVDDDDNLPDQIAIDENGGDIRRRAAPVAVNRNVDRAIERVRQQAIDNGVPEDELDEAFEDVTTAPEARERAFDLLANRSREAVTNPARENSRARDMDILHSRAADALAVRFGSSASAVKDNPLIGRSIAGIGREWLESNGVSTRNMDDIRIIETALSTRAMHSTTDFTALFVDGGQRVLKEIYETTASPLISLSRKRNAKDFRPVSMIRPGGFPRHKKITESGEIQFGTFDIEKEAFSIMSYAIALSVSRQMLVNDDLNAFSDILQGAGDSAVNDVGDLFYLLISENSFGGRKLADGNNLFHATHGNLATAGSALTVASLSTGRQAMRNQKGVDGKSNAGAAPSILLVGPALETTAEQLVASLNASAVSDVNPFSGKLSVKVENRYGGNGWWLFADPKSRPAFVHGYLEGEIEGPRLRSDQPFGRQGMSFSSEFDFGCGVYDHRAAYFNPGV